MLEQLDLRNRLDKATRWVDERTLSISMMIGLATVLWIVANTYYNDLPAVGIAAIKKNGKELGQVATICMAAALAYYILREIFVYGRKKFPAVLKYQSTISFGVVVLRRLHIWFGVLAVGFIVDHGYLMLFALRNEPINRIQTGLAAAAVLFVLAVLGGLIRLYPSRTMFRIGHRCLAVGLFLTFMIHQVS